MKRAPAGLSALVLLFLLSGCDLFNAPVKDLMNFYSKAVYAESWDDLSAKMQNASDGTIFMLSGEYEAGSSIAVPGNVTVAAAPGETVVIKRGTDFFHDGELFFNVTGSLALGHAAGGELILDGAYLEDGTRANEPLVLVDGGRLLITGGAALQNNYNNLGNGGAVRVDNGGTFTMTGGSISGNTAESSSIDAMGGGVYIANGTFTMTDGSVNGNTAFSPGHAAQGGGVCVATDGVTNGAFIMTGGSVTGNTAVSSNIDAQGGGVFISGNGNESGSFTMTGGSIGGNAAQGNDNSRGGGVYIAGWSVLGKSGNSVIYGYTEGDGNSNKVADNNDIPRGDKGHAVCTGEAGYHGYARKEGIAGHGVDLFADTRGDAYEYTGDWDYRSSP